MAPHQQQQPSQPATLLLPAARLPSSPPPHPALFKLAIRNAIFGHLDMHSLAAVTCVCREWFSTGAALLWCAPPLAVLTAMPSRCVAVYAPAIRRLEIVPHQHRRANVSTGSNGGDSGGSPPHADGDDTASCCVLQNVRFPALNEVLIDTAALQTQLHCALGVVNHSGFNITSVAIRQLTLEEALEDISWRNKELSDVLDDSVDESLFAGLRAVGWLPKLTSLDIGLTLRPALLRLLAGEIINGAQPATHPTTASTTAHNVVRSSWYFQSLQRLSARLYPSAVPLLVCVIGAAPIAHLDLAIMPNLGCVVAALVPLRASLRTLRIAFNGCYRLTPADISALSGMTLLTELRLQCGPLANFSPRRLNLALSLADGDLYDMLACLPDLEVLELQCSSAALSADVVGGIAIIYPRLRHLRLDRVFCDTDILAKYERELNGENGSSAFDVADRPRPLFPRLENLCLWTTGFQGVQHSDAAYDAIALSYALSLERLAPNLASVTFLEATAIDERVMGYFRDKREMMTDMGGIVSSD